MVALPERDTVARPRNLPPALDKIEIALPATFRAPPGKRARLIGPEGEEIEISEVVFQLLRQVIGYLEQGKEITIVPCNPELSTQEAADLLKVSRPYLIKLLELGELPYRKVGKHRRVRYEDVISYKEKRFNGYV